MRIRYLKPSFFTNEILAELPFETRIVYTGLWVCADRKGRLEDRPKKLKVQIMPYDANVDMEKQISLLAKKKFITRYEHNGFHYIQIDEEDWKEHQKIHHTEKESIIPPIPPFTGKSKGKGKAGKGKQETPNGALTVKQPLQTEKTHNFFKQFWEIYPDRDGKKPGKQEALDFLMTKTCPIKPLQYPAVLLAVKEYAKSDQWKKDAVRFLKKDYWKGWVPARPAPAKAPEKPPIVHCGECGEKYQPVSENDFICSGCKTKFETPEGQRILKERKAKFIKNLEKLKKITTPPPLILQKKSPAGDSGIKR